MRVVTINVGNGGGRRRVALVEAAAATAADVVVFTEVTAAGGGELEVLASSAGFGSWHTSGPTGNYLGVAIASRRPVAGETVIDPVAPWSGVCAAKVGGLRIVGLYGPGSASRIEGGPRIKGVWWDGLLGVATAWASSPTLLIGDLNVGTRRLDEQYATFVHSAKFERLPATGFRDAWREVNGADTREYSWWSNAGNGFRLDHAFVTDMVSVQAARCVRESVGHLLGRGVERKGMNVASDHAALVVDVSW